MPVDTRSSLFQITEARQDDVGRGIVRLPQEDIDAMDLSIGDVVSIKKKKSTVAKVLPGFPEDHNDSCVRMDGILRTNAGASLGEDVEIEPVYVQEARRLKLRPLTGETSLELESSGDFWRKVLEGYALSPGDTVQPPLVGTRQVNFQVEEITPDEPVLVGGKTLVNLRSREPSDEQSRRISYEDIGGLRAELQRVREMIELPLGNPGIFDRLGIDPPKGVLLHGPPGCGKTLMARAVAHETSASFCSLAGPEIMQKFYGQSEAQLREVFEKARKQAPSILFIDEFEAIAGKREDFGGEKQVEKRVVAQLLALMDGLEGRGEVIVIGATNQPDLIDPALRRPGRFDREIEIGIPDRQDRREILAIHTRGMPREDSIDLTEWARQTHGFVGADIEALCRESAMEALRRNMKVNELEKETIPYDRIQTLTVKSKDIENAIQDVEPSALREFFAEVPTVGWDDIGGLDSAKQTLRDFVEEPLLNPELYEEVNFTPPQGILLYGSPGTGKTLLARALAHECEINFVSIRGSQLLSKHFGESEQSVREAFTRARRASPCILFFDELDSLVPKRGNQGNTETTERIVSQFLVELDGMKPLQQVVVIGATNRMDRIDPAILRPGRFDEKIECPLPGPGAREEIFRIHTRRKSLEEAIDYQSLASRTKEFSGAEIEEVCRQATSEALRQTRSKSEAVESLKIGEQHFERAIQQLSDKRKVTD